MTYCSCSKTSASYALLESAMIKFLSRCCWCHLANQKLLAKLLIEVISQQRTTSSKCTVIKCRLYNSNFLNIIIK